jgi:FtsP/CotA-like multicopper oxidase with cupredoxin domain
VPGPVLKVNQGDRVMVTLVNHLPVSTTIHWHGVRLPNADDGVAGLTQDAVGPGAAHTYDFVARDSGTYWYHSHQNTGDQVQRGLFGALVVEPASGGAGENLDYPLVLHRLAGGASTAVNGIDGEFRLPAAPGQTVRLRLVNAVAPGMDGGPQATGAGGRPLQRSRFTHRWG